MVRRDVRENQGDHRVIGIAASCVTALASNLSIHNDTFPEVFSRFSVDAPRCATCRT